MVVIFFGEGLYHIVDRLFLLFTGNELDALVIQRNRDASIEPKKKKKQIRCVTIIRNRFGAEFVIFLWVLFCWHFNYLCAKIPY